MALVPDQKFSTFNDGGDQVVGDIIVGLRGGINTKFTYTGQLPPGFIVPPNQGGTGINNGSSTINLGTPVLGYVLTSDGSGNATWQAVSASGAVVTIDGDAGSANTLAGVVTISGGTTGLTTSGVSHTLSLTGTLKLANGGTNANLTASNGGIFYSTASAAAILAGTATANQVLMSGSSTTPAWSTATYPATTTVNQLLYSSSANVIAGLATGNSSVLVTSAGGVPSLSTTLPAGLTIPGYQTTITPAALTKTNDTNVTLTLGGTPATALLQATSLTLGWTGQLAITRGGTNVSSVTIAPTATAFAGWDANSNLSANNFLEGYATTVNSGITTTLTVSSAGQQFFTGATFQTVQMPVTSTLVLGQVYRLVNNSNNTLFVTSSGANSIINMQPLTEAYLTCILTSGTTAASWDVQNTYDATGVQSLTGTAHQIIFSSSTGNITASLPQSIDTTSSPTFASLTLTSPLTLANGGSSANLTASNGGIVYSTASAMAILGGTATANQLLLSGSSTTPAWSTSTYPATNAANTLLYASSANTMAALATANNSILATNGSGVPALTTSLPTAVQVGVNSLNSGTAASASTYWSGAGTWTTPAGTPLTGNVQTLSGSGTYTPTSGTQFIIVEMCAGGGGSGGVSAAAGVIATSASGAPGGYLKFMMSAAQIGVSLSYSVGAAGAAGTNTPGAGGNGGTTTFGDWTAAAGAGSALANSTSSAVTAPLNGTNTVGTGTVIQNFRSSGNNAGGYSVGTTFYGFGGSRALGQMGGAASTTPSFVVALNTGTGAGGFSGASYFGGGFGCGGPGTCQYVQATGSTTTNTGFIGVVGTIIVTEYI